MTANAVGDVFAAIEASADSSVDLLRALIRCQADGEAAVQAEVKRRLAALGGDVNVLRYDPRDVPVVDEFAASHATTNGERESVTSTFLGAVDGAPRLLLFAHPDAEPTGSATQWSVSPFDGVQRDGKIYGWGVADDLAGIATGIAAVAAARHAGLTLAGTVTFSSTPSKRHARGIAAVLNQGHGADAALYLHPAESGAGLHEIKAMTSGQLEFTITVRGQRPQTSEPGHTAFSHLAINPLDKAMELIAVLGQLADDRAARVHHLLVDGAVGRATNIMVSSVQFGAPALSQLPDSLTLGGAISFPPGEKMEEVQQEVEVALDAAIAADVFLSAHPPELRWISGVSASEVPSTHPFYRVVAGAVEAACGFTPRVNAMHTSSDIRNPLVQKGIPTLGLGPLCGDLTHAGGVDEWVDRADYIRAIKVAAATIVTWCGVAA